VSVLSVVVPSAPFGSFHRRFGTEIGSSLAFLTLHLEVFQHVLDGQIRRQPE
jgi:hypothetical protein